MSQAAGGVQAISRSASPGSLKRKRDQLDTSFAHAAAPAAPPVANLTNGANHAANGRSRLAPTADGLHPTQYTSPDSDEMQGDTSDTLHGVGSASSRGSAASSIFTQSSHAFAQNRKASSGNSLTPLTNHTESSPTKGRSPQRTQHAAEMASIDGAVASSHVPTLDPAQARPQRPQMLPPPGTVKGYRAVWDPELDGKLSKEERKRATFRKRDFGAEVRYTFHILLSLRNMIYIT